MIEANNPDIDAAQLERRIEQELEQPERSHTPPQVLSSGVSSVYSDTGGMALKLRLRAIPVLGPVLVRLNRWQRRHKVMARILARPLLGYVLRWMKSLLLVHETRGLLHQTQGRVDRAMQEAGFVEHRLNVRLTVLRYEVGFVEQRLKTELENYLTQLTVLRDQVADEKKQIALNRSEILFQQRRLNTLLENGVQPAAGEARSASPVQAAGDELDSYYAAFESAFRGSREEIRGRLEFYLDRVKPGLQDRPVLDIGCGRGEWIELLRDHGIAAYGIDMNSMFVADARESGLDVRQSEALAHLRSLNDACLAGITGFHIIEHLEVDHLIRILDEANRVLVPGGFLLVETPNPENLIVGASSFWNDPTHRAPLPPSVTRFMIEQRGFLNPEVIYLHPAEEKLRLEGDDRVSQRLNQLLYGAQDYAIWARKA